MEVSTEYSKKSEISSNNPAGSGIAPLWGDGVDTLPSGASSFGGPALLLGFPLANSLVEGLNYSFIMDLSHITSQSLRRVLTLTERKDELVKLVSELENEIAKVLSGVAAPFVTATEKKESVSSRTSRKSKSPRKGKSGGLKEKILSALENAGAGGLKIKEIATKVGVPAGNVSVWFSTTGKKLTQKLEPGRYAVKGVKAAPAPVQAVPAKTVVVKVEKKAAAKSTPLKEKILSLLEAAGPKGMRVKDIASKLNMPAGNISVWISTTGKNLLSKVEPGVYTVKGAKPAAAPAPVKKVVKIAKPVKPVKKGFKLPKAKSAK